MPFVPKTEAQPQSPPPAQESKVPAGLEQNPQIPPQALDQKPVPGLMPHGVAPKPVETAAPPPPLESPINTAPTVPQPEAASVPTVTPTPEVQPQPIPQTEVQMAPTSQPEVIPAPAAQLTTNNASVGYVEAPTQAPESQNQSAKAAAEAQAVAAMAIPNEPLVKTPEEFPDAKPDEVVAGLDPNVPTSEPSPITPDTQASVEMDLKALFKDFDPVVQGSAKAAFKLYFAYKKLANGDTGAEESAHDALTEKLVEISNMAINTSANEKQPEPKKKAA